MMMISMLICLDIPKGICIDLVYKLFFITGGFWSINKRNFTEFSVDFLVLDYFDIYDFHIGLQMSVFQTNLDIGMSCGFLGGVVRNWSPLKSMRRLSRIQPPGRNMTQTL